MADHLTGGGGEAELPESGLSRQLPSLLAVQQVGKGGVDGNIPQSGLGFGTVTDEKHAVLRPGDGAAHVDELLFRVDVAPVQCPPLAQPHPGEQLKGQQLIVEVILGRMHEQPLFLRCQRPVVGFAGLLDTFCRFDPLGGILGDHSVLHGLVQKNLHHLQQNVVGGGAETDGGLRLDLQDVPPGDLLQRKRAEDGADVGPVIGGVNPDGAGLDGELFPLDPGFKVLVRSDGFALEPGRAQQLGSFFLLPLL